ncbi:MAG TPA: sn-glycerol-3-phosphate ABC transporter ATP-binding protein UgpC [Thermoleophilaceae bacterium]|jgi:multiple sugar transport system ATP-binding protein|nr:sn-glycerol-3-phosphate ABC transporter ATP-binding protein UgpC [Thermoleophilaceae bacterium]
MADIKLDHVTKRFPDGYEAVRDMNLEIKDGEFMILVGPSGCGKSTALRMIAGLEDITDGDLIIGGDVVNERPPKDRDIAMVFQNYALYPHMTVRENMGFALRLRGLDKGEINEKVENAARVLDLEPHLDRKPSQLSGGQRQRVAMGRAIVRDPAAFLMDEPLSNLDAKLRVQMRTEVSRLQQRLGTTTIYVTHDQTEALTLGDRVAVMRSGVLQQVGAPMELYNEPVNLFVAGFIGSPAMNFMPATVQGDTVKLPFGDVRLPRELHDRVSRAEGRQLIAGIRPEHFEDAKLVGEARDRGATFTAHIDVLESLGSELYAHFKVSSDATIESAELRELAQDAGGGEIPMEGDEGSIVARLDPASQVRQGADAELWVDATRLQLFDPEDGRNLVVDSSAPAAVGAEAAGEQPATSTPDEAS